MRHIPTPSRNHRERDRKSISGRRRRRSRPNSKESGPPRGRDSPSGSDSEELPLSDSETSMESSDSESTFTATQELTRELRKESECRERFTSYSKRQYALAARLFTQTGYETAEWIMAMQEQARQYFLTDLQKGNRSRRPLKELRLTLEFCYLWPVQKNEDKPSYGEITIPVKLRR